MMKVMFAIMAVMVMSGCTTKTMDFMESMQIEGQHDKAMAFLGSARSGSGYTYKATPKAVQCLKDRIAKDGYYTLQADIGCAENMVQSH
jgi:uncharacterized protein YceK